MVADDDPDVLELTAQVVTLAGFDVLPVTGGPQALAALLDQRFDVAVLDVLMPTLTGVDVLRTVAEHDNDRPPVLMLMTQCLPRQIEAAFLTGADDVLIRPFSIHTLVDRVPALLTLPRRPH